MKGIIYLAAALLSSSLFAKSLPGDYLVKYAQEVKATNISALSARLPMGSKVQDMNFDGWVQVQLPLNFAATKAMNTILSQPGVLYVQPNYVVHPMETYTEQLSRTRAEAQRILAGGGMPGGDVPADNPAIPTNTVGGSGTDPMFKDQWGMNQIGVKAGWAVTKGANDMIVAVIDTGVDYTHEDLVDGIWHNPGEIAGNGIDDDHNGYIDDVIGWDFVDNDNKPFDFRVSDIELITKGGNPGHGTHCAGNVAARADNGKGIAGVAPGVRIMPLRFISTKGEGTTKDAVAAVKYAVDMGAKVTSNSWGSEGEDKNDPDNQALRDIIKYAESKGSLFIAAAGNGHQGAGYDNDTDSAPGYPASYDDNIIVSVAAVDVNGALGSFSNWGAKSVDIGAPGVNIFGTMVGSKYSNKVVDIFGMTATWDGTSMATPHVAGAAALYWSAHPEKTWQEVKSALLSSVKRTSTLNGKTTSGGALDVNALMKLN